MDDQHHFVQPKSPVDSGQTFKVAIHGGFHDGTSVTLPEGAHDIDANPRSALCLQDARQSGPRTLVLYKGKAALVEPSQVNDLLQVQRTPCSFAIGEARLDVTCDVRSDRSLMPHVPIATALVLATLGFGMLFVQAGQQEAADTQATAIVGDDTPSLVSRFLDNRVSVDSELTRREEPLSEQLAGSSPDLAVDPMKALQERLTELGIDDQLTLDLADGVLHVRGTLDTDAANHLQGVRSWYDELFSQALMARWHVDVAEQATTLPPIAIESIWFSGRPHIVANGGRKYFEGSIFGDGWTVIAISTDNIVLARQGKETVIELDALQKKQGASS